MSARFEVSQITVSIAISWHFFLKINTVLTKNHCHGSTSNRQCPSISQKKNHNHSSLRQIAAQCNATYCWYWNNTMPFHGTMMNYPKISLLTTFVRTACREAGSPQWRKRHGRGQTWETLIGRQVMPLHGELNWLLFKFPQSIVPKCSVLELGKILQWQLKPREVTEKGTVFPTWELVGRVTRLHIKGIVYNLQSVVMIVGGDAMIRLKA